MNQSYRIYLSPPTQNGSEVDAVKEAMASNWLAPVGPHLATFEQSLAALQSNRYVLALNSGTAAIHLALQLCGVGAGDEVIVATHTHNATVNPIIYQGATPIFVDSESETWNISPKFLEEAIEDRLRLGKSVKAILIVHLYGMPAFMDEILDLAKKHNIPVIEDAAEALGSTWRNLPLGALADMGILSFNGNKIITTSGGGALVLTSEKQRERALYLATQARDSAAHFQHSEIGYNYRLSNVLAALGTAQLQDLTHRVKKRRENFNTYAEAFSIINEKVGKEIITTTTERKGAFSNRWLSTFLVEPHQKITAETWRLALLKVGIESRPLWKPMHLQPVFEKHPFYGDHTSDRIFERGICLPSGQDLTSGQLDEIIQVISSGYN